MDALVYVDTDVMFLAPLEEIWKHFSAMNSSHMAAMAPEHEDLATGWYNRFAKHPYFGRLGELSTIFCAWHCIKQSLLSIQSEQKDFWNYRMHIL